MSFLYFCYGSNLLTKRMHINCPSAQRKCIAKLKDFKLAFQGYCEAWKGATATVIESPGDTVWGVVWEISKEQEPKLDRQEIGYKPIEVTVEDQGGSGVLCKSYQKLPTPDNYNMPSLVYKTVMIYGAQEHQLPKNYIQYMEAIKDNGYKNIFSKVYGLRGLQHTFGIYESCFLPDCPSDIEAILSILLTFYKVIFGGKWRTVFSSTSAQSIPSLLSGDQIRGANRPSHLCHTLVHPRVQQHIPLNEDKHYRA